MNLEDYIFVDSEGKVMFDTPYMESEDAIKFCKLALEKLKPIGDMIK